MAWSSCTAGKQKELTCIKWMLSCHQQRERERERVLCINSLSFIFAVRHLKMCEWVNTFMQFLILWLYSSQFICAFFKKIFCHVCSIFAPLSLSLLNYVVPHSDPLESAYLTWELHRFCDALLDVATLMLNVEGQGIICHFQYPVYNFSTRLQMWNISVRPARYRRASCIYITCPLDSWCLCLVWMCFLLECVHVYYSLRTGMSSQGAVSDISL